MTLDTIILIRVHASGCELDFCEAGHYDDFPKVAEFIASVLDLKIDKKIDGPSERVWSFDDSAFDLVNDPYGTTLKSFGWANLPSLQRLVDQYLKNKKTIDMRTQGNL